MEKKRAQIANLLMVMTMLALLTLLLNHLPVPSIVVIIAFLTLIVLGVVTLTLMWRVYQQTRK